MMVTRARLRFDHAAFSEQGPRSENQDAFSTRGFEDTGLLALADGMGGEKSGRIAAETALEALRAAAPIQSLDAARRAVHDADRLVTRASAANPDAHGGMGCALALLALADGADGPGWIGASVGDVRILSRSPDGVLRLETRDHTPAFSRWEAGEISLDEIADSAGANRLQRAVGRGGDADVYWIPAAPGWSWVLVSDGVYKALRHEEIGDALSGSTAAEACETIRKRVLDRGADDNFTAVVVRALGELTGANIIEGKARPMTQTKSQRRRGSATAWMAALLAIAALALAGLATRTALEIRAAAVPASELQALRAEVDSLRVLISQTLDPFGPAAPPNGPLPIVPQAPGTP